MKGAERSCAARATCYPGQGPAVTWRRPMALGGICSGTGRVSNARAFERRVYSIFSAILSAIHLFDGPANAFRRICARKNTRHPVKGPAFPKMLIHATASAGTGQSRNAYIISSKPGVHRGYKTVDQLRPGRTRGPRRPFPYDSTRQNGIADPEQNPPGKMVRGPSTRASVCGELMKRPSKAQSEQRYRRNR